MSIRFFIALVVLMAPFGEAMAQVNMDSARSAIAEYEGTNKVDALTSLAIETFNQDRDASDSIAKLSLRLAREQDYAEGQAEALKIIGAILNTKYELTEGFKVLNEALSIARKANYEEGITSINYSLGSNYAKSGLYDLAIECFMEGLDYARRLNDVSLETNNLLDLGVTYSDMGEYEMAEKFINEGLEIIEKQNIMSRSGFFAGSMGSLQLSKGNYALAEKYLQEALGIVKNRDAKRLIINCWVELSTVYAKLSQERKSITYLDSALNLSEKLGHSRITVNALKHKAGVYLDFGRFEKSQKVFLEAMSMKDTYAESPYLIKDLYQIGVKLSEKLGDYKQALDYHRLFLNLKDSLDSKRNLIRVAEINARYNYDQLQNKAEAEQRSNQISQLKISQRNFIIIALISLIMMAVVFIIQYRARLKNDLLLAQKDHLLIEKESELKAQRLKSQNMQLRQYEEEIQLRDQEAKKGIAPDKLINLLRNSNLHSIDWLTFKTTFEQSYPLLFENLQSFRLTVNEEKLVCLVSLGLTTKEVAELLAISPNSVVKAKSRLAKKLGQESSQHLDYFFKELLKGDMLV